MLRKGDEGYWPHDCDKSVCNLLGCPNDDETDNGDDPGACPECGNPACFGHGYYGNDH